MRDSLVTDSADTTELRVRLVTATILTPVAILASFAGGWLFLCLVLPVMCIGMLEFYVMEFYVMEKDTEMRGSWLTGIPTGIAIVHVLLSCRLIGSGKLALVMCIVSDADPRNSPGIPSKPRRGAEHKSARRFAASFISPCPLPSSLACATCPTME